MKENAKKAEDVTARGERIRKMTQALVPWYLASARPLPWREDTAPYHVWLSEIMLQQTRIETVIPYYQRFLREIPDVAALAAADPEHLRKLWEGLGYYSRVRNLQTAAGQIMTRFGGRFPETYEEIRSLCGIGDYSAGAIASICFDLPTPAVDGNVLRVLARINRDGRPITDEKLKKSVREELAAAYPAQNRGACTQAIMELGERVCLPGGVPDCAHCPCRDFCGSADGDFVIYPVRAEKKSRRTEQLTVFLLRAGEKIALRKRPPRGLLSDLWEFPNCAGHLTEEQAFQTVAAWGCAPTEVRDCGEVRHIFTHVEWEMRVCAVICASESPDFVWADEDELSTRYALPTAFRKAMNPECKL